jgi:hypothetical protein
LGAAGRGPHTLGFNVMSGLNGMPSNPSMFSGMATRIPTGHEMPLYPNQQGHIGQPRSFASPDGMPMPPGINGSRPMVVPGRGFPLEPGHGLPFHPQPPGPGPISVQPTHISRETGRQQTHSRQPSGSYDRPPLEIQSQNVAISRPTPIQRPSSTTPHDALKDELKLVPSDIDTLSAQLGSSALLDDTDVPLTSTIPQPISAGGAPGAPGSGRIGFGTSPLFPESIGRKSIWLVDCVT